MATAAVKRYWEWLALEYPLCVCGRLRESFHHIIHLNGQRITNDDMLVIGLCRDCHQGNGGIHDSGGERQFEEKTGWNLVHLSVLRRHDFEMRNR